MSGLDPDAIDKGVSGVSYPPNLADAKEELFSEICKFWRRNMPLYANLGRNKQIKARIQRLDFRYAVIIRWSRDGPIIQCTLALIPLYMLHKL